MKALITLAIALALAGCGTTQSDALSGKSQSIGHQTAAYSLTEQGTVWNAVQPPSHTTLADDGYDVISPILPSVINLKGVDLPFEVFMSSAADYRFDSAAYTRNENGEVTLEITGFAADRSAVYEAVLVSVFERITAQVEAGNMTQQEGITVMGSVAEALAALAAKSLLP